MVFALLLAVGGQHGDHGAGEHPVHDGGRQGTAAGAHRAEPLGHAGVRRCGSARSCRRSSCTVINDVGQLADLYAIGVVGAVALNLGACSTNRRLKMARYERVVMMVIAVLMVRRVGHDRLGEARRPGRSP